MEDLGNTLKIACVLTDGMVAGIDTRSAVGVTLSSAAGMRVSSGKVINRR